ncbi:hypothetical protein ACFX13_031137 [Malus domestica]
MGTPETSWEPCPDRILDDISGALGMGTVGGSAFHFIKGVYRIKNYSIEPMVGGSLFPRIKSLISLSVAGSAESD